MNERFEKRIIITRKNLSLIARIDEIKGRWAGSVALNSQTLSALKKSVVITSTGASTRIEGAKLTDIQVERFLRSLHHTPPTNRDEEGVAGYADLLGRIFDHAHTFSLSGSLILQFHEILLHFSQKDQRHKGAYKTEENKVIAIAPSGAHVTIFEPTPAWLTKKEMDDVLFWTQETFANQTLHPLLIIANFIFEFLAIHPFTDGNGRLSRALTNMLLLQSGYAYTPYVSLEELIEKSRDAYYSSLRETQSHHKTEAEDTTAWIEYFLHTLLAQAEAALILTANPRAQNDLSPRQSEVFAAFKDAPLAAGDIHALLPHVPLITIKQALARLVFLHLIKRRGSGRATRYTKNSTHLS